VSPPPGRTRPDDLLVVTAHELRSPLAGIIGAASALETDDDVDPATRTRLAGIIVRQGRRLERLVDDLLAAARFGAGHVDVAIGPVDLAATLHEVLDTLGWPEDGDHVEVRCPVALVILGDPDRVIQVLVNLLGNARRHGRPPIHLDAERDGDWVEVRVRDHGDGVAEAVLPTLFRRWESGARSSGGLGLGLYLVAGLMRAMGGEIWYEEARPGARFAIRLPAA
jgi:two-component system sensor histidine kinase MtrB